MLTNKLQLQPTVEGGVTQCRQTSYSYSRPWWKVASHNADKQVTVTADRGRWRYTMLTNKLQSQPTVEGGCNAGDERGAYSGRVCLGSEQRLVASDELWRSGRRELAAPRRQCIQLRDQRHLTVTTGL